MGKKIITLVGPGMARIGEKFIFTGPVDECRNCKLFSACAGNSQLEVGRIYEILKIRPMKHKCLISEDGVVAVEVAEATITLMIPAKYAVEGLIITFQPQPVSSELQPADLFKPEGLKPGDKIKIIKVWKEKQSYNNETFVKVTIERIVH
ncbi:MAG: UPF0179 family protein [Thermoprotei archaeon]